MSRLFYHVMQDNVGNLLFDVSGTMRVAGSGTLATIYGDEALTVILPNPMTNHPSFASFKCFLGAGDYDFYMAKAGYTFETLTGVQGHGTMAQQDAHAVAITGGTATGLTLGTASLTGNLVIPERAGNDQYGLYSSLTAGAGTGRFFLLGAGSAPSRLEGPLGLGKIPDGFVVLDIGFPRNTKYGIALKPIDNDTGGFQPIVFNNVGGSGVGSITTTASATTYNTSSDGRLKEALAALPDALATILALRPVRFRWKATGDPGEGFVAQDVQPLVPQAVCGDPHDPTPNMQMDLSRLVPHLVGAVQELAQQVQTLTARLEAAGA